MKFGSIGNLDLKMLIDFFFHLQNINFSLYCSIMASLMWRAFEAFLCHTLIPFTPHWPSLMDISQWSLTSQMMPLKRSKKHFIIHVEPGKIARILWGGQTSLHVLCVYIKIIRDVWWTVAFDMVINFGFAKAVISEVVSAVISAVILGASALAFSL